jgi:dephospho-CoA kinase
VVADGAVDRGRVGAIVFDSAEELVWLESLLHPLVGERVVDWRTTLAPEIDLAVVEVPLLFETDMQGAFDATVAVIAADETRAQRAGLRGTELLESRSDRQLSQEEKAVRATYVLSNDGSLSALERAVAALMERITQSTRSRA